MKKVLVWGTILVLFLMVSCAKKETLQWSNRSAEVMNWESAVNYCSNLNENGFSSWRLPNIDELRTIMQNCPKTEPGGQCKVSEKSGCLSSSNCWRPMGSCFCDDKNDNGGYYSKLGDPDGIWLWSSSTRSDSSEMEAGEFAWNVSYDGGYVVSHSKSTPMYVRCVR